MKSPTLKTRGAPARIPDYIKALMDATASSGHEIAGPLTPKQSWRIRHGLNYHGAKTGLKFTINATTDSGLWIERKETT